MRNSISKKLAFATALFVMIIAFSSCNRGYGCPYELKTAVKIISPVLR